MADNAVVEHIIDSLAFEIEALPQDDVLEVSDTSKATPLNLKIRVRKKDKALFDQGVVSVPKLGHPKKPPEQIRLVNSDHTVLSFKVFVDTHPDKKPAKKRKRFFGGCLSSEDNDDDPYMDSNPATTSRPGDIVKQNFGLSKTKNLQDMQLQPKKPVMFLGNRCKPGGCLDPPLDEDLYSYKPNNNERKVSIQEKSEPKKRKLNLPTNESVIKKETAEGILKEALLIPGEVVTSRGSKEEIEPDSKSIQSIYQADFLKTSLDAQHSDSIITYPPDEIVDDISDKPSSLKRTSEETRKSFPEFRDSYFIPQKNVTNSRNNSDADKDIQKAETNFVGQRLSDSKRIFLKVEPEENTAPNIKSMYDPKILRSGIDIEDIQSKTSTLLEDTSNSVTDANEFQSKKDLKQSKDGNVVRTALRAGVLATPLLIAEAAMNKIESNNNNNGMDTALNTSIPEIHSDKKGVLNTLEKKSAEISDKEIKEHQSTFDSLSIDLHPEQEKEKSSKYKNTVESERSDTTSDFADKTKIEKNETFGPTNLENKILKEIKDIKPTNEILSKTKKENISQDKFIIQDYTLQDNMLTTIQSRDQPLDKYLNNEDYLSKVGAYKGSLDISHLEENKDIVSQPTGLMELDKSSQTISHMDAYKNKDSQTSRHISEASDRISGNLDNIKEHQQHDSDREEQQGFFTQATKKKKLFQTYALKEHDDLNKNQRQGSLRSSKSDKANMNDILFDSQHCDKAQRPKATDPDSYQDSDLSDHTFERTQNNEPLKNNAHYIKDKHDQFNAIKNEKTRNSNNNENTDFIDNTFDQEQNYDILEANVHYNKDKNYQSDTKVEEIKPNSMKYKDTYLNNNTFNNNVRYNTNGNVQRGRKTEEKTQDYHKYEDVDLSDDAFDQIQDYPFDNSEHYNENKKNQRDTKSEGRTQDSNKYKDADLYNNTFDQTQNYPLHNSELYNKNTNNQRATKNEDIPQDSNKYKDTDLTDNTFEQTQNYLLDNNALYNKNENIQPDRNTEENIQDSHKYENADLSDDTFEQIQNNSLDNSERYNRNKKDQRDTKDEEKAQNSINNKDADLNENTFDQTKNYLFDNSELYNKNKDNQHATKNEEKSQDSNKYKDADLTDNALEQTQNYLLDKNARYNKNENIQRDRNTEENTQDSHKYEGAGLIDNTFDQTENYPLDNNVGYNEHENIQRNRNTEENTQDFHKYKDADLSDDAFKQIQNYPSDSGEHYNKNKNYQRDTKNEEKHRDANKYKDADLSHDTFDKTQNHPLDNNAHNNKVKNDQRNTKNEETPQDSNKYDDADLSDIKFDQIENNYILSNNVRYNKNDQHPTNNEEIINDSNKNKDTLEKNAGYNKEKNDHYDTTKYQDPDNTFNQIKNSSSNYPLDNNASHNKYKNNQRDTEYSPQYEYYQQKTATDDTEHDKVDNSVRVSILKKQEVGKDYTLEPTRQQVFTPHQDKGSNIAEEILKPSFVKIFDKNQKINKTFGDQYKPASPVYNFVNMDIAFHSYINDQNESVIKTLDNLKEIKRRPQDNITIIKSQVQLDTPHVITIPIDNQRNLTLEIKASDFDKPSSSRTTETDMHGADNDENFAKVSSQQSQKSIPEIELVLSAIYEQQLVPLQSLISDLKKDVDILGTQQMWLKENWKRSKRTKTIRLTHSSRKCVCFRKLNGRI